MTAVLEEPRSPRPKKWTKQEYLEIVDRGAFGKQRVYLFRGDIIEMAPQSHPHQFAIMKLSRYLTNAFPEPYEVRIQLGFLAPGESVPEPDAAVCTTADVAVKPSPSHAELIVEVAYTSLAADRDKAEEYAAAQVPEYWIIDVDNRCIEVYRWPVADSATNLGYRFQEMRVLRGADTIAPLDRPDATVPITTFFAGD